MFSRLALRSIFNPRAVAAPHVPRAQTLASLIAVLFVSGAAFGQVRAEVTALDYDVDTQTARFDVEAIDFERRLVMFRHVYSLRGDPSRHLAPSVDCGYAGLEARDGEVWGLFDIAGDRMLSRRVVAAPARTADLCTAGDIDALRSEAARAYRQQMGPGAIDQPVAVRPEGRADRFSVYNKDVDQTLTLSVVSRRVNEDDRRELSFLDSSGQEHVALARLLLDDRVLYSRYQGLNDTHDVGREISFSALYISSDSTRIVVLERFAHEPEPNVSHTYFSFSGAIDLNEAWKARDALPKEKNAPKLPPPDDNRPLDGDGGGDDNFCSDVCCCGACACGAPPVLAGICGFAVCENACAPFGNCLFGDGPDRIPEDTPPKEQPPAPKDTPPKNQPKDPETPPDSGQWTSADTFPF